MEVQAKFSLEINDLSVQFTDRSSGLVSTYSWDFGFKDSNNNQVISSIANPLITFPSSGKYIISLIITALAPDTGTSKTSSEIVLYDNGTGGYSIAQMVRSKVPSTFSIDEQFLDQDIQYWQLYLQPLVNPTAITDIQVHDEKSWPYLYNNLIAGLVAFDIMVEEFSKTLINLANSSASSNGTSQSTSTGSLKAMEMGPSRAEWYNTVDSLITLSKTSSVSSSSVNGSTDMIGLIRQGNCQLAQRLGVNLPYCPQRRRPQLPIVAKFPKC